MTSLAERFISQDLPCADCGRPLWRIYPNAKFAHQWGHTTLEDTRACPRTVDWPVPSAEGIMAQLDAARAELDALKAKVTEQLEPWLGKAGRSQ